MTLRERIEGDLKQAMLARNEVARDTLRMVLSELKKRAVDQNQDDLAPDEELAVLQRAVKTRQESVEQFDRAGRTDLSSRERAQIAVLEGYLPRRLSEDETRAAVQAVIAELGLTSKKDVGQLMKPLMSRHKGAIDGKLAQRIAGELLA